MESLHTVSVPTENAIGKNINTTAPAKLPENELTPAHGKPLPTSNVITPGIPKGTQHTSLFGLENIPTCPPIGTLILKLSFYVLLELMLETETATAASAFPIDI